MVWQQGRVSAVCCPACVPPVITPEGLWIWSRLDLDALPAVRSALSERDSLSWCCCGLKLIKLVSITQNDEAKPECFCKFIFKKGKAGAPLAALGASSLLGLDSRDVNFRRWCWPSLGFLQTQTLWLVWATLGGGWGQGWVRVRSGHLCCGAQTGGSGICSWLGPGPGALEPDLL